VVVVQWHHLWEPTAVAILQGYQAAGIEVYVHTPFSYIHPDHDTPAHVAIRAVLDETGGWLKGPNGLVGDESGVKFIDPRDGKTRRGLLGVHVGLLENAGWEPDGLFLDWLWDSVAWKPDFAAWPEAERKALDNDYRMGLYRLALGLVFKARRAGMETAFYGNGWHRCTVLDGTVREAFPFTNQEGGRRDLDVALNGYYGKATWELFRSPPMILPAGGTNVAYNIPRFRVVEAVGFAAAFCPGAVVFDNSGFVFDVAGKLAQEVT
jgi:hypothetical protein